MNLIVLFQKKRTQKSAKTYQSVELYEDKKGYETRLDVVSLQVITNS